MNQSKSFVTRNSRDGCRPTSGGGMTANRGRIPMEIVMWNAKVDQRKAFKAKMKAAVKADLLDTQAVRA